MERFFKGIIVGLGGVAPGLSGSVLLIIFGLYQKTLDALGSILSNFRKNIRFLLPLVAGMFFGVLLFSRLIDYLLACHEVPTRFCFLGLILGTLPMVWREVKKKGFSRKYYILVILAAFAGFAMFTANADGFPQITNPTLMQCIALGVAVAATAIIPGVDPAVFLSTLGFYEMYVGALANLNLAILFPMVLGLGLGAVVISFLMSTLFRRFYTATYSVIFGIFLSMIPNMLSPECTLAMDGRSVLSGVLMIAGFALSYYLGDFRRHNTRIRTWAANYRNRGYNMLRFIGFYDYTVILTYLSLLSAVFGMVFSHQGSFTAAILCLMVSGLCDAFDGTVARSKKNRTEDEKAFGIQLDSLCDMVSFGIFPAFLCYCMGMDGIIGMIILGTYCVCAVIRLAFFNVLEAKRQQTEEGSNKVYRGLPVTTISIIFPLVYLLRLLLPKTVFTVVLHGMMAVVAFLFIWDVPIRKLDLSKIGSET